MIFCRSVPLFSEPERRIGGARIMKKVTALNFHPLSEAGRKERWLRKRRPPQRLFRRMKTNARPLLSHETAGGSLDHGREFFCHRPSRQVLRESQERATDRMYIKILVFGDKFPMGGARRPRLYDCQEISSKLSCTLTYTVVCQFLGIRCSSSLRSSITISFS